MKTAIDAAGRLVIPLELRRAAGLRAGVPLEIRLDGDSVVIEAVPTPMKQERRGRFVVAVPGQPLPVLTAETVERTRAQLRTGRGSSRGKTRK